MNDDTTWDTDEVQRWIANDEGLHDFCRDLARMNWNEIQPANKLRVTIDWLSYGCDVDENEVDWEGIAGELLEEWA